MEDDIFNLKISEEWFKFGHGLKIENAGSNPVKITVYQFIVYWIAFNAFYSKCGTSGDDRQSIKEFVKQNQAQLTQSKLFEFNCEELQLFRDGPVFRGADHEPISEMRYLDLEKRGGYYYDSNGRRETDTPSIEAYQMFNKERNADHIRFTGLLLMIYQVRCNLFHGAKHPNRKRNIQLVEASLFVLEALLPRLIDLANTNKLILY